MFVFFLLQIIIFKYIDDKDIFQKVMTDCSLCNSR